MFVTIKKVKQREMKRIEEGKFIISLTEFGTMVKLSYHRLTALYHNSL